MKTTAQQLCSADDRSGKSPWLERRILDRGEFCRSARPLEETREVLEIILQISGVSSIGSRTSAFPLSPGQWTIWSAHRTLTIYNDVDAEQLALYIPADLVLVRGDHSQRCAAHAFGQHAGVGRLVGRYLQSIDSEIADMTDTVQSEIVETAAHLIRLATQEAIVDQRSISMRDSFRHRIDAYIDRHLHDPALSIDEIARALNCSKRYLHIAFRDSGETLSQHIWSRRLERCWSELADRANLKRSITDVAFSWGFNNAAHFSRMFKLRYGLSPREHRVGASRQKSATYGWIGEFGAAV